MADCLAICSCSTGLSGSSFAPASMRKILLQRGRNALLKAPVPFGQRHKRREGIRQTTRLAKRVACSPFTRAGLGDASDNEGPSAPKFTSEDWQYLGKVLAGCTAGAGVIKYGSIFLPQITEPNLVIALLVITAPVIASVILLNSASSKPSDS